MAINWNNLNTQTEELRSLVTTKDVDGKTVNYVIFSGLEVRLSELIALIPENGIGMTIWADTLIMDYPIFTSQATVVIARKIDTSIFSGEAMPIMVPTNDMPAVAEFCIGGTVSGEPFSLTTSAQGKSGTALYTIPGSVEDPEVGYFYVNSDETYNSETYTSYSEFNDLINRPYALNALKSSFIAASELINLGDDESLATAKSMLQWVVSILTTLTYEGNTITSESYVELYSQASALLTTVNVQVGSHYVPVLSSDYYEKQATKLLDALTSYESDYNTLTTAENIESAISEVSSSLEKVSKIQAEPLQSDMDNIIKNAETLGSSIQEMRFQFELQSLVADRRRSAMEIAIKNADMDRYFKACFETAINVAKVGIEIGKMAAKDPDASPGSALESGAAAVGSAYTAYKLATKEYSSDALVSSANALVESQRALADSFVASSGIWYQLSNDKPITKWPASSTQDIYDVEVVWNNYQIEAERVLSNLAVTNIGDDEFSAESKIAAENYLAALKMLIQYGKAANSKMISYSELLSRAITVKSEIDANKKIEDVWKELKEKATSDEEKLAGLKGVLKSRMNSIKRSIFIAWVNYNNSYLYLYFEDAPANSKINTGMTAGEMKLAFANVTTWVGKLLGETSLNDRVTLPNKNVPISFTFPITKDSSVADLDAEQTYAVLTPSNGVDPAKVTVSIPRATKQLVGVLPNGGNVPIWIKEAKFFIEGAVPNSKGNIMFNASTSGSYENGFPTEDVFNFETDGMESSFGYKNDDNVYISWDINPEVYMTPSPFTQWTLDFDKDGGSAENATSLRVEFNVTFLSQN